MPRRSISLSAKGLGTFEAQSVHTGVLAQLIAKRRWVVHEPHAPLALVPAPAQVVSDFLETRKHRFAFTGHILIGRNLGGSLVWCMRCKDATCLARASARTGDKHNAWHSAFRQAMEHPAVVQFWQAHCRNGLEPEKQPHMRVSCR